jgi:hypothetical protein
LILAARSPAPLRPFVGTRPFASSLRKIDRCFWWATSENSARGCVRESLFIVERRCDTGLTEERGRSERRKNLCIATAPWTDRGGHGSTVRRRNPAFCHGVSIREGTPKQVPLVLKTIDVICLGRAENLRDINKMFRDRQPDEPAVAARAGP